VRQPDAATQRLEAFIHGRVQGVGFRWFVLREAARLGLTGWVSNRADGSVAVLAEGAPDALDRLQRSLAEGPDGAHVERLEASRQTASGDFDRFQVRAGGHMGD
jgi:acylphosphatase